jgi:class 3 adenylate cyclase/tetratricopeptide (TPR) repeat protein
MICGHCQHDNPAGQKFCGECGAALVSRCDACGSTNPPGQKFCGECGRPLAPGRPPVTPRFGSPESYTPRHLAERILTSKAALEGERKQVTVLFADLKGSMELLADRDPEEARKLLDPVLERMMEAVHRYEGTVNQVMGDGIMALFGAPLAHEDHAVRACYAALRMHDAIRRYTEELRRSQGIEVQIRVGINSGDVVVRTIDSDLHMDYTAVGQTTHLAARMEQLAPPGTTRLTPETLRLAEGFVQVKALGPIPVRGLAEPVEVFELVGAGAVRTRLQASRARGFSRFVGRDPEMDQIRQAADQAGQGRGQIVAVVGEPGVGKSRLFYEFIHSHRTQGRLVLEASSVSYGKATPFLPLADLLRAYFRIDDRDDTRSVRSKVTGALLTLDRALEDALPAVMWLLDALAPDDRFLALEPKDRRQRAIDGVKRLFLRESHVQPVVLVFEDLHWIDAETQRVLDSIVDSLPTAPILLAVNYRPEYRHDWGNKTYYRQLRIDPLAPESADELLQPLLGDDPSVQPLKRVLIARTEGNPLFLEESVRTLVETRVLVGEPGAYRLAKSLDAVQVPATVQAILAARIDRLRPELKRLLQAASVVGKDVPVALLEPIAEMAEDELRQALAELQTAEFLYEARLFPDLEYTFKHALTHDVAYSGILQDRRRALHAAIVEAIERIHAGRLAEQVEVLAHHAVSGGITGKAVRYLHEAGVRAAARSANQEAVAYFTTALGLLDAAPETPETISDALDIRIALGPTLIAITGAGAPVVEDCYGQALKLVERLDDTSRSFPVLWGLWFVNYNRGKYTVAREAADRLLTAARSGDDSGRLLEAHHALWATGTAMGEPAMAVAHSERGIELYDRERHASQALLYGGHDAGVCCRYQMAMNQWLLGFPDRAVATMRDAHRLAEELRHPMTTTITLWIDTWVRYQRGERDAAAAAAERLIGIGSAHGFTMWIDSAVLIPHAVNPQRLAVETLSNLHRQLMKARSAAWRHVFCLCLLAELCADAGHPNEGRRVLASVTPADRVAFCAPEVYRLEGDLLLREARPAVEDAERCFRIAIDLARDRAAKSLELRATMSLARLWRHEGRPEDARRALADVYGWFTEGFDTADLRAARALLEDLHALSPNPRQSG